MDWERALETGVRIAGLVGILGFAGLTAARYRAGALDSTGDFVAPVTALLVLIVLTRILPRAMAMRRRNREELTRLLADLRADRAHIDDLIRRIDENTSGAHKALQDKGHGP